MRRAVDLPLSVDTRKGAVARRALAAGADLVNDVGGLADAELLAAVAEAGCPVVVMHSRGELGSMQRGIRFRDVTREVADELAGDGDGLAVVRDAMESMNGSLSVESTPKMETRVSIIVPIHQAMQRALLVVSGGIIWGIPETAVDTTGTPRAMASRVFTVRSRAVSRSPRRAARPWICR